MRCPVAPGDRRAETANLRIGNFLLVQLWLHENNDVQLLSMYYMAELSELGLAFVAVCERVFVVLYRRGCADLSDVESLGVPAPWLRAIVAPPGSDIAHTGASPTRYPLNY